MAGGALATNTYENTGICRGHERADPKHLRRPRVFQGPGVRRSQKPMETQGFSKGRGRADPKNL